LSVPEYELLNCHLNRRVLKDFLLLYNHLTEACFSNCVFDFNRRNLAKGESSCVEKCVAKYMNLNRKIADVFAQIGPSFIQRQHEQQQQQSPSNF
uniref:Mitochondrial import inner membrane translocase subunit n=1 Tax=Romanomermis culicivorax TaxID=13658 RepID=A0A915J5I5_ROMCU